MKISSKNLYEKKCSQHFKKIEMFLQIHTIMHNNMSFRPIYKLRTWVPSIHHMDYESVLNNPNCIDELEKQDMMDVTHLSGNPAAIEIIEKNMDQVDFAALSHNTGAVHLFQKLYDESKITIHMTETDYNVNIHHEKLCLFNIAQNPAAIPFIEKNYGYLLKSGYECSNKDYHLKAALTYALSMNPNAIHLLENINTSWIHIESLLMNPNGWKLLEKNDSKFVFESYDRRELNDLFSHNEESLKMIMGYYPVFLRSSWIQLHYNPSDYAIEILKTENFPINWELLCCNENPKAVELLKQNKDKINWHELSKNPSAIELLEEKALENPNSLHNIFDLEALATNPAIYILDHEKMKKRISSPMVNDLSFVEELTRNTLHPERIKKYLINYQYDLLGDEYI